MVPLFLVLLALASAPGIAQGSDLTTLAAEIRSKAFARNAQEPIGRRLRADAARILEAIDSDPASVADRLEGPERSRFLELFGTRP